MINVLQLGLTNWAQKYRISDQIKWEFNSLPLISKKDRYSVVIVSGKVNLTGQQWEQLHWLVDPYCVLYVPGVEKQLTNEGKYFLNSQMAQPITEDIQHLIDHLPRRYFFGQSGIRIPVSTLMLNRNVETYEYIDSAHLKLDVDTKKWINIGNYRSNLYLNPKRLIKMWLEYQQHNVQIRLHGFIQPGGGDGDPLKDNFIIDMDSLMNEIQLPVELHDEPRFASISLEIKGQGQVIIGNLHSRWSREGYGDYIAGGQRLVNEKSREEIAYYFNPGDLRPPLNVYFSGARSLEGFEAYPTFRKLHTPTILFTDPRLEVGQFYTTPEMESQIKNVINNVLKKLGFDQSQLIMNGISMGTYPAIRLGSQLGAYMINVAKPIANLGLVARRGRLERPNEFETIYDIDHRLIASFDDSVLDELDEYFWDVFNQQDLTQTRLFIGYMADDDYDNQAIEKLKRSPAVRKAKQFAYKGFPGHHNDSQEVNKWFLNRLKHVLKDDFNREVE